MKKLVNKINMYINKLINRNRDHKISIEKIIEEAEKELLNNFDPEKYKYIEEKQHLMNLLNILRVNMMNNSLLNLSYDMQSTLYETANHLDEIRKLSEESIYGNIEINPEVNKDERNLHELSYRKSMKLYYRDMIIDAYKEKKEYTVIPIEDIKNDSPIEDISVIILKDPRIYIDDLKLEVSQAIIEAKEALKKKVKEKIKYYESKKYTIEGKEFLGYL